MTTDNITIGLDLFVGPPAGSGHPPFAPCAALRAAPRGATISALPRFVGDRRHAACVLSASGDIVAEEAITNTRECLSAFAQRHPGATFVMETGTHCSSRGPQSGHPRSLPSATLRADAISALPRFVAVGQPDARDVRERGTLETACHRG